MKAAPRFHITPTDDSTELRLLADGAPVPRAAWALAGHAGVDLCERLLLDGQAIEDGDAVFVEHAAIARLTAAQAMRLDLPPLTTLRAVVEGSGPMMRGDFTVSLRWTRPTGQNVLGAERVGAWLREAEGWRRLPGTLFGVAHAVAAHAAVVAGNEAARLHALARLREALPAAATAGTAEGSGMLGTVTILEADALSLETMGEGDAMQLVPVLHRAGKDHPKLLPEDRQHAFGADQFHRWPTARAVYALPGGIYVILAPPLRQALDVVRQAASGSPARRRMFLREPRAAIRAAIGDEADAAMVDNLLLETPAWSERVIGLGLWQPRVLPWIALPSNEWFGPGGPADAPAGPRVRGLQVGDSCIALTRDAADALGERIAAAMARNEPTVTEQTADGPVRVPASPETLATLKDLYRQQPKPPATPDEVLIIKPNETGRDIEALVARRPGPEPAVPTTLRATLKAHQREGLQWLQRNWLAGSPGVLLADDMGLGKTLQGLAFLSWLRGGMDAGRIGRAPLLIVAPTGLLENWRAEHDRHLAPPGLGAAVLAYGKGLAALRRPAADGATTLDLGALRAADWVLTTYETLRDHDRDFGRVRFAALLFDEAQKVKTPGIRLTDAAKGMNADFRVALTGTPVENRLSDLWCIVDGVAAGHLGDLRRFSATYEANADPEKLKHLKAQLDQPYGGRPALLLRRLKEDRLPDLPPLRVETLRTEMGPAQIAAYEAALSLGRDDRGAGRVLAALQRLRAVSLHPDPDAAEDDAALIGGSARLRAALGVLDAIKAKQEAALLFVESVAFMARLTGLLQRRYALANAPMTISGKIAGPARQARVDRFQAASDGFDVMLLSPKAGGVGLTLTRANHVIHLERWWNPAVEDQCNGRALRIGQERSVTVYLPLAVLPDGRLSFDSNLHALLTRKRLLMRDALLPPEAERGEIEAMLRESLGE